MAAHSLAISLKLRSIEHGRRIAGVATPFGFPASAWAAIREHCASLADMLEAGDSDEDDIHDLAARLRDTLVRMI